MKRNLPFASYESSMKLGEEHTAPDVSIGQTLRGAEVKQGGTYDSSRVLHKGGPSYDCACCSWLFQAGKFQPEQDE